MAEQKAKPAATKVVAAKTSSKLAAKPKSTKATLTTPAKKTLAKKSAVAEPRKSKAATVKKAAAPDAKKTVAAKKPQAAKPAAKKVKAAKITPEERYRLVETTAYFIAERHGFQGRSDEHWAAAELEVAARLGQ